jgi:hypothetical protein
VRKEEGGRRKEEGGRRKEEGGRRKQEIRNEESGMKTVAYALQIR